MNYIKYMLARLGFQPKIGEDELVFFAYCPQHRKFYLDTRHTNGEVRCPECDEEFLRKRGITQ